MMVHTAVNDRSLWTAARNGDESAFSELFGIYFPKLYHFAFKYTNDGCLAEDVVQQVFLKWWLKKDRLGDVENMDAYLYACVKHEVLDIMRRQVLHLKYQKHIADSLQMEEASSSEIAMRQMQEEIFAAAINHLPPQQKKVYKLSKEQGLSYAQIAREMKISIHTVKWHAAAAFQSLKHFLKRHEQELFVLSLLCSTFF